MDYSKEKIDRLKALKKRSESRRGLALVQDNDLDLANSFVDGLEVDDNLLNSVVTKFQQANSLDITDEAIDDYITDLEQQLKKLLGKNYTDHALRRELAVRSVRIDALEDYDKLLWDAKANVCSSKSGFISNQFSKTIIGRLHTFDIKKIKDGDGAPVIFINGFLSHGNGDAGTWSDGLSESVYKDNPYYVIDWDASSVQEVLKTVFSVGAISKNAARVIAGEIIGEVGGGVIGLSGGVPGAVAGAGAGAVGGVAVSAASGPLHHWYSAMKKTEKVAELLSYILQCTDSDDGFVLMGHSLGARVIYYLMEDLALLNKCIIQDVYLFGGAVGKDEWAQVAKAVRGSIHNCYSEKDQILKWLYKSASLFSSDPIGLGPMGCPEKVNNVDGFKAAHVDGHTVYKDKLKAILSYIF